MSEKPDIRSYCNPLKPSHGAAGQIERLTGVLYTEDKTGKVWEKLRQSIRPGSMVEVVHLFLLAPTKGSVRKRADEMLKRIAQVRRRGGIVIEEATGRRSDQPGKWDAALVEARERLGRSGKGAPGRSRSGRPNKIEDPALREKAENMWRSRRYKTRDEAVAAISEMLGRAINRSWCYANFGTPSGKTDKS